MYIHQEGGNHKFFNCLVHSAENNPNPILGNGSFGIGSGKSGVFCLIPQPPSIVVLEHVFGVFHHLFLFLRFSKKNDDNGLAQRRRWRLKEALGWGGWLWVDNNVIYYTIFDSFVLSFSLFIGFSNHVFVVFFTLCLAVLFGFGCRILFYFLNLHLENKGTGSKKL